MVASPHRGSRAALPLAAAALLAAVLLAAGGLAATTSAATPPRCTVAQLHGGFKNLSAGAGSRFATLVLTNTSRSRCSLFGYPGAQLLNARNRDLPTHVVRDRSRTPRTVVLAPGASAASQWRWGAIAGPGEPARGRCQPNPARIEVTPPNARRFLVLPWRMGSVCQGGTITVRPMTPR